MNAIIRFRIAPNIQAEPPEWTLDAACLEYPGDLWYPEKGSNSVPAKRICAQCPVRDECLTDAMLAEGPALWGRFGIVGGLSPNERNRLSETSWTPGDEAPPIRMPYANDRESGAA